MDLDDVDIVGKFNDLIKNQSLKYDKEIKKIFEKIYNFLQKSSIDVNNINFDVSLEYESLSLTCFYENKKIYLETYPYTDQDVFESILVIDNIDTEEIEFATSNTLNNNLYDLSLKLK